MADIMERQCRPKKGMLSWASCCIKRWAERVCAQTFALVILLTAAATVCVRLYWKCEVDC